MTTATEVHTTAGNKSPERQRLLLRIVGWGGGALFVVAGWFINPETTHFTYAGDAKSTVVQVDLITLRKFAPAPAAEVAAPGHEVEPDPGQATADSRLNVAEILSAPIKDEKELGQRVDLLCRLMAKLVERLDIPESEIIEVLIKSGVEF